MGKGKDYINLNLKGPPNDKINKLNDYVGNLGEDGKYFKVDKDGINCELCHKLEGRVFLNLKKFTEVIF